MRKHFLLLMLTVLLPLASWADDITVNLVNLQYEYGAALPTDGVVTVDMFSIQGGEAALPLKNGSTTEHVTKAQVAAALQINIVGTPGNVGNYTYTLTARDGYNDDAEDALYGHNIFLFGGGNDGLLKIVGKPITITAENKQKTYGTANPDFTAAITAGATVGEEQLTWTVARTSSNENAGTYDDDLVVTITSEAVAANYDITLVKGQFKINQKEIAADDLNIELGTTSFVYDGTAKQPTVTVKDGTTPLATTDYTVSYFNNTNVVDNSAVAAEDQTQLWVAKKDDGNYTFAAKKATFAITKAPLTIAIKAGQKKEYGAADPTLELDYTGLVNEEVAATLIAGGKLTAPTLSRVAGENAGIYAISMGDIDAVTATNYEISLDETSVNFSITAKALGAGDPFTWTVANATKEFTGSAITNSLSLAKFNATDLVENTDYTLSYEDNTNVGTAKMIITGKGNFKGSIEKTFEITAAGIFIIPTAAEKTYGAADPTEFEYTLKFGETTVPNTDLHGNVELARVAGENVGTYKIYVKNYTEDAENPDNYTVSNILNDVDNADAKNKTALFTIKAPTAPLVLKFKDLAAAKKTKVYGEGNPAWNIDDLTVESGLAGSDTWDGIKTSLGTPAFALSSENVGTVSVNVTGLVSSAYPTVTVQPMTDFTITARPITVTLSDQTIAYGAALGQVNPTNWNIAAETPLAGGDDLDDLGLTVKTVNAQATYAVAEAAYTDAITATIDNNNYNLTVVKGKLTVNAGASIELNRTDDMDALIKAYGGKKIDVTLNRNITRTEAWFAMVLPFETTVTELSNKYGYAVVNVLNEANDDPSVVKFKLYMQTIAANQPFLIKIATAKTTTMDFGAKDIVYAAEPKSVDAAGNKFIGVFKTTELEKSEYLWTMVPAQNKFMKLDAQGTTLSPISAYLKTKQSIDAFAPTILVEEIDGTVTAINAVEVGVNENNSVKNAQEGWYTLQGVKLESAPTEKGIYIFNGKKVAVQ